MVYRGRLKGAAHGVRNAFPGQGRTQNFRYAVVAGRFKISQAVLLIEQNDFGRGDHVLAHMFR